MLSQVGACGMYVGHRKRGLHSRFQQPARFAVTRVRNKRFRPEPHKLPYHACKNIRARTRSHDPAHARCFMNPEDLQRLVTQTMPYGKYKGRLLADLPGHYLGWLAREGFPPDHLGRLLALMYELDHNALRSLLDPLR